MLEERVKNKPANIRSKLFCCASIRFSWNRKRESKLWTKLLHLSTSKMLNGIFIEIGAFNASVWYCTRTHRLQIGRTRNECGCEYLLKVEAKSCAAAVKKIWDKRSRWRSTHTQQIVHHHMDYGKDNQITNARS